MKIQLKDANEFSVLLIRNGYSKRALAQAAKIGEATLIQISNGDRNPSPATAKKIADALQVGWDDLFTINQREVAPVIKISCKAKGIKNGV